MIFQAKTRKTFYLNSQPLAITMAMLIAFAPTALAASESNFGTQDQMDEALQILTGTQNTSGTSPADGSCCTRVARRFREIWTSLMSGLPKSFRQPRKAPARWKQILMLVCVGLPSLAGSEEFPCGNTEAEKLIQRISNVYGKNGWIQPEIPAPSPFDLKYGRLSGEQRALSKLKDFRKRIQKDLSDPGNLNQVFQRAEDMIEYMDNGTNDAVYEWPNEDFQAEYRTRIGKILVDEISKTGSEPTLCQVAFKLKAHQECRKARARGYQCSNGDTSPYVQPEVSKWNNRNREE